MALLPFLVSLFTVSGISHISAQILSSAGNIYLQPGEVKNITLWSNTSKVHSVLLRTKLPHIATVTPLQQVIDLSHPAWKVQVTGHHLGYTQIIAAINTSNMFSFEDNLVQITVMRYYWIRILSSACGWIYFSAWTFSFYPQIMKNNSRKSVVGLNFDFLALNELGYVCYSLFNCCLYLVPSIQAEYFRRHSGATNPVLLNDVLFSVHGFFATTVIIIQVLMYEKGDQTVSRIARVLIFSGVCALVGILLAAVHGYVIWLDAIVWISFIKLIVTITKYIPQALMNYRYKSTEGWSIEGIFCDLTGSCFSLLQMILISYNCNDWVSILGDPTKFGLGLFSIGFDIIFMVQHYILYRTPKETKEKEKKKDLYETLREFFHNRLFWIKEKKTVR